MKNQQITRMDGKLKHLFYCTVINDGTSKAIKEKDDKLFFEAFESFETMLGNLAEVEKVLFNED